jgi:hypothetical protein
MVHILIIGLFDFLVDVPADAKAIFTLRPSPAKSSLIAYGKWAGNLLPI